MDLMRKTALTQMLAVPLVALAIGCGSATEPQPVAEETPAEWIDLFDGETLNGWEDPAAETPPGDSWVVEDGWIKAVNDPTLREDLFTKENFGDFELVFEWKISKNGNSGVKYRVQDRAVLVRGKTNPDAKRFEDTVDYELVNRVNDRNKLEPSDKMEEYVVAYEYQLIDNAGHPDALKGAERSTGAIYSMVAPNSQESKPVGEVNESRIVLRGNHVEHWLNGVKVVDTVQPVLHVVATQHNS